MTTPQNDIEYKLGYAPGSQTCDRTRDNGAPSRYRRCTWRKPETRPETYNRELSDTKLLLAYLVSRVPRSNPSRALSCTQGAEEPAW